MIKSFLNHCSYQLGWRGIFFFGLEIIQVYEGPWHTPSNKNKHVYIFLEVKQFKGEVDTGFHLKEALDPSVTSDSTGFSKKKKNQDWA